MMMKHMKALAFIFFVSTAHSEGIKDKCIHLRYPNFTLTLPEDKSSCAVCSREYHLMFIELVPYCENGGKAIKIINEVLNSCCKRCIGFKLKKYFHHGQLNRWVMKKGLVNYDMIYPVLGYSRSTKIHGGYFIQFYNPSGGVYLTRKEKFNPTKFMQSFLSLWPLLVIGISLVMIAGFICWILDSRSNKEEFPLEFVPGWWEGIWWSITTMTTVGYGDKSPKSVPARLFAFVWMYFGIVVCGILTASITTIVIDNSTETQPSMVGAKVGMLRNRLYDAYLIANNGGDGTDISAPPCRDVLSSIFYLLEQVKEGKLDGFLLDKQTFWRWKSSFHVDSKSNTEEGYDEVNATTCEQLRELEPEIRRAKWDNSRIKKQWMADQHKECWALGYPQCRDGLMKYFVDETTHYDVQHTGDEMAYGIWIKNRTYYNFFRDAYVHNAIHFKSELALHNLRIRHRDTTDKVLSMFFQIKDIQYILIINGTLLGVIILFGVAFEWFKKNRERISMKTRGKDKQPLQQIEKTM